MEACRCKGEGVGEVVGLYRVAKDFVRVDEEFPEMTLIIHFVLILSQQKTVTDYLHHYAARPFMHA
jgi:hypothetical protein